MFVMFELLESGLLGQYGPGMSGALRDVFEGQRGVSK